MKFRNIHIFVTILTLTLTATSYPVDSNKNEEIEKLPPIGFDIGIPNELLFPKNKVSILDKEEGENEDIEEDMMNENIEEIASSDEDDKQYSSFTKRQADIAIRDAEKRRKIEGWVHKNYKNAHKHNEFFEKHE